MSIVFFSNCLSCFRGNSIGARFLCNPPTIYEYLRIEPPEDWLPPEAMDLEIDAENPEDFAVNKDGFQDIEDYLP